MEITSDAALIERKQWRLRCFPWVKFEIATKTPANRCKLFQWNDLRAFLLQVISITGWDKRLISRAGPPCAGHNPVGCNPVKYIPFEQQNGVVKGVVKENG